MRDFGVIFIVLIVALVFLFTMFLGQWGAHNTELLINHYQTISVAPVLCNKITLPRWPFVIGACVTPLGIPYWLVTEVWCHCVGVK